MSRRFTLLLALCGLVITGLACSLAGPEPAPAPAPTQAAPATAAATPAAPPPVAPPTKVQIEVPTAGPTSAGEVRPTETFKPEPSPTATPTGTATATPTPKPTVSIPTKSATAAPLTIRYEPQGIKRNPNNQAVLTLKVIATGGSGNYTYYHDDQKQAGATFDVLGSCGRPFVHTVKVTSSDGQSAAEQYFIAGNCPTPTPTPKP